MDLDANRIIEILLEQNKNLNKQLVLKIVEVEQLQAELEKVKGED